LLIKIIIIYIDNKSQLSYHCGSVFAYQMLLIEAYLLFYTVKRLDALMDKYKTTS